ncbi:30S ribosomal protein S3 [Leptospira sp. 85282-16]|uniref:Small ribosomal subunit protein uS3 n=1 Tax=Leptospira montravelensis TaxID=2484961 RepID=A0ABY2LUV7_9LEPT|nr:MULTISPECIES: 30S ribosomal protein S3 [Leptospira]MCG6144865.1 30S ribosomal protein S3 [Leptospira bandrabouensis]MCG6160498.1 30S ribosomal protein S3 [Leptospira bandrabouensis]MCG6164430.1 30S ribosomal protein S3 [Leptospira bandrabouensis]MCT8332277.1 30S ribosomal protein S3 [Leptospira sp. 85282-16]TGK83508.1 30S ribosomal protein S3 [Leptospira montravelensis]
MGQKVNPIGLRIGITRNWDSIWYSKQDYIKNLHEDIKIRRFLQKKFKNASVVKIVIERFPEKINVNLHTSKPGMVIGQKGQNIEAVKQELKKYADKPIGMNIIEVKKPEVIAQAIAETVALQIEQRMPFRRVMKAELRRAMRGGVEGVKIQISGRLNGADMARTEKYMEGRVPLHTLRAKIDFGFKEALTTFGQIGVKVWTYTGDYFPTNKEETDEDKYAVKRRTS